MLVKGLTAMAEEKRVPVWCEAGNERARDVYVSLCFLGFWLCFSELVIMLLDSSLDFLPVACLRQSIVCR